jgi:hypothetical protein
MLGRRAITVTAHPAGAYVDGVWVPGAPTTRTVEGSVQPLAGAELERLPEGLRERATLKLYTAADLYLGELVDVDGLTYVVQAASSFGSVALTHTKYTLVERGTDE